MRPDIEAFWSISLDERTRPVVWVSRWSARQMCGLLEWLRRRGDRACDVVDLADIWAPGDRDLASIVPVLTSRPLARYPPSGAPEWAFAAPLSPSARVICQAIWSDLRRENAPLRIMTMRGLSSAGLDVIDEELLRFANEDWMSVEVLIGRFMGENWSNDGGFGQVSYLIAASRVAALANAGRIETRGSVLDVPNCAVRLSPDAASMPFPVD